MSELWIQSRNWNWNANNLTIHGVYLLINLRVKSRIIVNICHIESLTSLCHISSNTLANRKPSIFIFFNVGPVLGQWCGYLRSPFDTTSSLTLPSTSSCGTSSNNLNIYKKLPGHVTWELCSASNIIQSLSRITLHKVGWFLYQSGRERPGLLTQFSELDWDFELSGSSYSSSR